MARLVDQVGAHWVGAVRSKFCLGFSPCIVCVQGALQKQFQGYPPLMRGVKERGGLAGLVDWLGACWVGAGCQNIYEGFPPWIVFV